MDAVAFYITYIRYSEAKQNINSRSVTIVAGANSDYGDT